MFAVFCMVNILVTNSFIFIYVYVGSYINIIFGSVGFIMSLIYNEMTMFQKITSLSH